MSSEDIFTTAIHAGTERGLHEGGTSVPIYNASAFGFADVQRASAVHEGHAPGYFYGRMGTPTQAALEAAMSEIEGGEATLALASGMAAITTALLAVLGAGDHLVAPRSIYASTSAFMTGLLRQAGVSVSFVDGDPPSYAAALRPNTRVLYVETPSNPTLSVTDLAAVATLAREHDVRLVVDNTFATPFNQRPLEYGADLVVHSASKYLGGHGDLIAGVVVGRRELIEHARWQIAKVLGGTIAPMTAWLVLRGLRTLPLRMQRHNANAQRVAEFLQAHPGVREVHYPGLRAHPAHQLAGRQMRGFGGVVSFDVGSLEAGTRCANAVRLCTLAVSLGDVASLIQHSASMTHASLSSEQRRAAGISDGMLRLSVGLEQAQDIIDDLDRALEAARRA